MLSKHFGMAQSNKFNIDGSFRPFAGNTVFSSRDRLSVFKGIPFSEHDVYRFHVGLACGRKIAGDDGILFFRIQDQFNKEFLKTEISFHVPTPHFCTFPEMSCITPYWLYEVTKC